MTAPTVPPLAQLGAVTRVGIERLQFLTVQGSVTASWASVTTFTVGIGIGSLRFDTTTGEIGYIWVAPGWRRRGIATALLDQARMAAAEHGWAAPKHSAERTALGDAWAQARGAEPAESIRVDNFDDPTAP